jgi:hypothetical protein
MSFYESSDAIYGSGRYGSASYGRVSPNISLTGVNATGAIESVSAGGFEIDITERISTSVVATGSIGTVEPQVDENLNSVSSTGSIGTLVLHADSQLTLTGVTATASVNEVEDQTTEKLGSVSATGAVQAVAQVKISERLASVPATGTIGFSNANVTAVNTNFNAFAENYSRRRTVILPRAA